MQGLKKNNQVKLTAEVIFRFITKNNNFVESHTGLEDVLIETYPNGSVGAFMTKYFEMAFKGRDEATEFEKATVELFHDVFGYKTKHVGPIGLTPDVLLLSDRASPSERSAPPWTDEWMLRLHASCNQIDDPATYRT